jgi:O-antigen ligase
VALFLVATALLSTHSRGGFIAAAAGLLALAAVRALAPGSGRRRSAAWLAGVALLALVAVAISGGPTLDRLLGTDINGEERRAVWKLTLQAIAQHPLTGTGLGTFWMEFPVYRTAAMPNYYNKAHNDYLENLLDLGIPAALCLFTAAFWLAFLCLRGARRRRRDAALPGLGFAASALVGVHSLTDFSLQIPAVTTVYLFLLGTGVAQSRSPRAPPR